MASCNDEMFSMESFAKLKLGKTMAWNSLTRKSRLSYNDDEDGNRVFVNRKYFNFEIND